MPLEVIILAAGRGTRMHSDLPKVLHPVGGKPMLSHVLGTALSLEPARIHVVIGHGGESVRAAMEPLFTTAADRFNWVVQTEQNGTGHAVRLAMPDVDTKSRCLILYGDVPLVSQDDLHSLCRSEAALAILTASPSNPSGLGRILRDSAGNITGIVEQRDASPGQLAISEINTGILLGSATALARWLNGIGRGNRQEEYYLTDVVALATADGETVHGEAAQDPDRFLGINSRGELATAERTFQRLAAGTLMEAGVTLMDPARIDIRGEARFGRDCVVDVNVVLEGIVEVGDGVTIGPGCVIRDARIGNHCRIHPHSVLENAELGNHCQVGPFARLRPDSRLGDHVRVGNFVEVKNSELAEGSKANHLAYIGDSTLGRNTNFGAGAITCNYDGARKHRTVIGDDVFVGSDSQLVAPVRIADGVTIGAGTTVTRDVDQPALVVSRARQVSYPGWKRPARKPER